MLVEGRYSQVGSKWVAEIPLLYTVISSRTGEPKTALVDDIKKLAEKSEVHINFVPSEVGDKFYFEVKNIDRFLPIILKRTRLAKKLSIGDITKRLGFSSRNSYAQYEYGKTKLTFAKYLEFIEAMDPELKVVLSTIH